MNISTLVRSSIALLLLSTFASAQPKLIHYWHFNNTPSGVHVGALNADYSTLGNAFVAFDPVPGVVSDTGYMDNVAGDTINARQSAPAGNGIRTRNPSDSMQFVWVLPTTHYKNIILTWETQSSSVASGPHFQNFDYSLDGGTTYTSEGLTVLQDSAGLAWGGPVAVNLTPITGANNNNTFVFRIRLSPPNTGGSGNNRYDNITVEGDTIITTGGPTAPSSPGIAASSLTANSWTGDSVVTVRWTKATSTSSTIAGYSYMWDHTPTGIPDTIVDGNDTSATKHISQGRNWYFHLLSVDATGLASLAVHFGPINVDTAEPAPPQIDFSSSVQGAWSAATRDSIHWKITPTDTAGLNNIMGYAVIWSQSATTTPDTIVTTALDHAVQTPLTDGVWYAHLRSADSAKHWSATTHYGPIRIDHKAPTAKISITGHAAATTSKTVSLVITASDSGSGVATLQLSNDGTVYAAPMLYTANVSSWDLSGDGGSSTAGIKHVYLKILDSAGNSSAVTMDSIRYAPTDVSEFNVLPSSNALTVFPNPASSTCTIQFNSAMDGTQSSLRLYDALGREVMNVLGGIVRGNSAVIDATRLPVGVYAVRWATDRVIRSSTITVVK